MQLSEVELHDPDVFVRGVPHDALRRLRAEAPIYFHHEPGGPGFWVVSKYDDVVTVGKDPGRFSSHRGGTNILDYPPEALSTIQLLMLNMDPPQHNKFRRLVSQGFTPRMVTRLEPRIREATRSILGKLASKTECDFVTSVAAELPLQVIAELIGIPQEDRRKLFDWSNRLIGFDDPEFQTSFEDGKQAAVEMWMYANEVAEARKGNSGDDFVSVLMNAEIDGTRLTEMEFDAFFLLLAVAGNETTRNLISGGMLALIEHPEQRARLLADPSLIPSAVEEMLRWVTPVMHFRRTAIRRSSVVAQRRRRRTRRRGTGRRSQTWAAGNATQPVTRIDDHCPDRPRRRYSGAREPTSPTRADRAVRGIRAHVRGRQRCRHRARSSGRSR